MTFNIGFDVFFSTVLVLLHQYIFVFEHFWKKIVHYNNDCMQVTLIFYI